MSTRQYWTPAFSKATRNLHHTFPILGTSSLQKGAFNNYMDKILPFFDPNPPCVDSFYTLSVDKNRHFLTPSPPHLVHVVIECPLTDENGTFVWRGLQYFGSNIASWNSHCGGSSEWKTSKFCGNPSDTFLPFLEISNPSKRDFPASFSRVFNTKNYFYRV